MKTKILLLISLAIIFGSCNYKSDNYKSLEEERDSIAREKLALQKNMEEYFSTMNLIELNIEKIKNSENLISMQSYGEETSVDARTKINEDLALLNEMLKANREEIDQLKAKLKKSSFKSGDLERTIERLTKALDEEALKIKMLETTLAKQDSVINSLNENVTTLNSDIENLNVEKEQHVTKIKEQDETIHTAWYVFGTRKELKEQKIVTSEGWFRPGRVLESDFNKNYFVKIDARKTKSIPLYSSRAKILSSHPKSSYTLEKENNNFTLLIINTQEFWSVSKYLVIEVD